MARTGVRVLWMQSCLPVQSQRALVFFSPGEAHATVTVILKEGNSAVLSAIQGVEHKGNFILVTLLPLLLGDNEDIIKEEEVHLLLRSSFRKKSSVFYICC